MKIILNDREEIFDGEQLTIDELLQVKKFTFKMLIVKINGRLIKKSDFDTDLVEDGDNVMVLHLVAGG